MSVVGGFPIVETRRRRLTTLMKSYFCWTSALGTHMFDVCALTTYATATYLPSDHMVLMLIIPSTGWI